MHDGTPDQVGRGGEGVIFTGNGELDKRIAEGLPPQSITLVEGKNGTGKSVLTRQIMNRVMKRGRSIGLFTIKSATKSFVTKMEGILCEVSKYFILSYLSTSPYNVVVVQWNKEEIKDIIRCLIASMRHSTVQVAII